MDETDCTHALNLGFTSVQPETDVLILGEMGIGNTTVASTLSAALFGGSAEDWVGRGTGVNDDGLNRKIAVVEEALRLHGATLKDPLQALRCVGGRELAAITGAILAARHHNIPVVLDGFVVTAAAAVLFAMDDTALDHCMAGHVSAELAHRRLLEKINKNPLLDLGMRLGEGSGAAVALGILKAAVATHTGMATFDEARVGTKS